MTEILIQTTVSGIEIVAIEPEDLPNGVTELIRNGGRMQMAYAWYVAPGRLELRYLASRGQREDFFIWRCSVCGAVPSVAAASPLIGWYEREITDLFGVEFAGHPEPHRLVLHAGARPITAPLDPDIPRTRCCPSARPRVVCRRSPELTSNFCRLARYVPMSSSRWSFSFSTSASRSCIFTLSFF